MRPASLLAPALALAAAFALAPAAATAFDIRNMTADERAAFDSAVRDYLLANPEVMIDVSKALQDKQAALQASDDKTLIEQNAAAIFSDGYSYVGGNPDGNITLVEFLDYRCAYCRKAHESVAGLVKSDGNIRYVVKEFPILGEESVAASRFAIAALKVAGPEAYGKINAGFYETFRGEVTPETLAAFAQGLGIDAAPILAAMNGDDVTRVIEDNHRLAETLQIQGTPTFVLGGQMLRGYVPVEVMQKALADARG